MGSGTTTPVPTSTPQPSGRSRLHNSDPTSYRQHIQEGNVQNSFIGVVGQVELQTSSRAQPEPKNTNTCDTTVFYPGEVPFKNQGTSTSPIITEITRNLPQQQTMGKGGKKRVLKRIKSTHNYGQAPAMMAPVQHLYSHLGTQVQVGHTYSAQLVVEMTILGKIVNKITFCSRCRSRSHATHNAEHLPRQVRAITFVCTVVASLTCFR